VPAEHSIVQGDARLTIAKAPDASYDLIFVDAFIGAAIPIHLLTREAMAVYLRKLKPNGIVALHVELSPRACDRRRRRR
jgi:spermidine synthase